MKSAASKWEVVSGSPAAQSFVLLPPCSRSLPLCVLVHQNPELCATPQAPYPRLAWERAVDFIYIFMEKSLNE